MTFRDVLDISSGNLWRMKLRSTLTTAGIVIAIAAFVSMMSFGAGMQENVNERFSELGLLSTMYVYPPDNDDAEQGVEPAALDDSTIAMLSQLQGVKLVYPFQRFSVSIKLLDTTIEAEAQALPVAATSTKRYSELEFGEFYSSDSAKEAIITNQLLESLELDSIQTLIGQQIVVSVFASSIDSGIVHVIRDLGRIVGRQARGFDFDSLSNRDYLERVIRTEADFVLKKFVDGFMNARAEISDTLTIVGILKSREHGRLRTEPLIIPVATARTLTDAGFTGDPSDLLMAVQRGSLFASDGSSATAGYPRVTLDLETHTLHGPLQDSIEALGYRTFSYVRQFDEIRKVLLYFKLVIGVIGFIALVTASLGIVNTMVMSISERRKEIGVLKSLGADDWDIRRLFLVESGVIGFVGAALGIVFGWLITKAAALVLDIFAEREGVDEIDLFALPLWLIGLALAFGIVVAVMAGYYPAVRAARVDPVVALRSD